MGADPTEQGSLLLGSGASQVYLLGVSVWSRLGMASVLSGASLEDAGAGQIHPPLIQGLWLLGRGYTAY